MSEPLSGLTVSVIIVNPINKRPKLSVIIAHLSIAFEFFKKIIITPIKTNKYDKWLIRKAIICPVSVVPISAPIFTPID
jgi:hypothetical protein